MKRHHWLSVALVISLSFNAGLLIGGWRSRSSHHGSEPDVATYPTEFFTLCDRLQGDLQHLRADQAEATHELAGLMACPSPNRAAIDICLDRLTATDRAIKHAVVDTVLSQREVLPENERVTFCNHVQRRLCESFADCASSNGCAAKAPAAPQESKKEPMPKGGIHDS